MVENKITHENTNVSYYKYKSLSRHQKKSTWNSLVVATESISYPKGL